MAGDDHHPVGIAGAALDGDDILDQVGVGMRRLVTVSPGRTMVRQPPQPREIRANSCLRPVQRRADPPRRTAARRERVPRAEAHQPLDRLAQALLRDLAGDGAKRSGRRRRPLGGRGGGEQE